MSLVGLGRLVKGPCRRRPVTVIRDAVGRIALYTRPMAVAVELPDEALRRIETEAARRGVTVDEVIADLAAALPVEDPLEAFIGCGASGATEPFDIRRERRELAEAKLADGLENL